jgi:uncharacterized membrane protein YkvI
MPRLTIRVPLSVEHHTCTVITQVRAAQVHLIATHAEHATHQEDKRPTQRNLSRNFSKLYKVFICFLLVSSSVLIPYGMGGFYRGYTGLRQC